MTSLSDNFNRSDGNLDGSTASGGGTWVEFQLTYWSVASNAAYAYRVGNHRDACARLDSALATDDHEVEVTWTIDNLPGSSYYNFGVIARKEDNSTKTMYCYLITGLGSATGTSKFVAGSYTSIASGSTNPSTGDTIKLRCDDDQISGYLNGTLEVGPSTDSSIAGAGYIQGGLMQDVGTQNGNISVDDWAAADYSAVGRTTKNTDPQMLGIKAGVSRRVNV